MRVHISVLNSTQFLILYFTSISILSGTVLKKIRNSISINFPLSFFNYHLHPSEKTLFSQLKNQDLRMLPIIIIGRLLMIEEENCFHQPFSPQFSPTHSKQQTTFMLIKPDGVQRGCVGLIIDKIQKLGLKLLGLKLLSADRQKVSLHYDKHKTQPYFNGLIEYMISGPIIAIAWKGPNAIALVRKNITDSTRSNRMGTLRGNYSMFSAHFTKRGDMKLTAKNVCHASENREEAESEVRIWFPEFY